MGGNEKSGIAQTKQNKKNASLENTDKKNNSVLKNETDENKQPSKIGSFFVGLVQKNQFFVIVQLVDIVVFAVAILTDYFELALLVFIVSLAVALFVLILRDYVTDLLGKICKSDFNPVELIEWFKNFSIIQIIVLILMGSLFFSTFIKKNPERYYQEMDTILGPVIETKFATISPSETPTPTATNTPKPSITPSGGVEYPLEYEVNLFVRQLFTNLIIFLNDKHLEENVQLPSFFCERNGKAYTSFNNFYREKYINKYTNRNSTYEISCILENISAGYYDRGSYWLALVKNKCEVICSMDIYHPENEFEIEILKPNGSRKTFCIYKFDPISK